ncbi:MAG: hypothetical protein KF899_11750 [Parvibaculum sp.]|nr:hypothetical protein [Parvibaculum sp.]
MNGATSQVAAGRAEKAARFRPYFDLQLRFAEAMAAACGEALAASVTRNTNLHRRFGFGRIDDGVYAPEWADYLELLAGAETHEARLDATCAFFLQCTAEKKPDNETRFGCFGFELQGERRAVRIHFGNREEGGISPLSRARMPERLRELREMLIHIRAAHPEAASLRGGSWLYRVEAYRRLFPPEYIASCTPAHGLMRFDGTSSWGQFLDRHGGVKPDLRDIFLRNLPSLDPKSAEDVFPLPAMRAEAPIAVFHEFYGS